MSFDTEFDYTGSITLIDNHNTTSNLVIANLNSKLSDLGNIDSSFDYLTSQEITRLNSFKDAEQSAVDRMLGLKSAIQTITSLPSDDKANLYSFYSNALSQTTETKQNWMCRMIYNTSSLVADAGNVVVGNITTSQKGLLAEIICQKYPINPQAFFIRHLL
jgi:hypothetical protein